MSMWRMRRVMYVSGSVISCPKPEPRFRRLNSSGPETAASGDARLEHLVPDHARRGEHDALRQAVAALNRHITIGHVEQLDHHLVRGPGVVGIDDADAVGHDQSALERGAASGEDG